jgi:hypothetical protein
MLLLLSEGQLVKLVLEGGYGEVGLGGLDSLGAGVGGGGGGGVVKVVAKIFVVE